MVNRDKTSSFEKFSKIWFFIFVHNAQTSLMQSAMLLLKERLQRIQIKGR